MISALLSCWDAERLDLGKTQVTLDCGEECTAWSVDRALWLSHLAPSRRISSGMACYLDGASICTDMNGVLSAQLLRRGYSNRGRAPLWVLQVFAGSRAGATAALAAAAPVTPLGCYWL